MERAVEIVAVISFLVVGVSHIAQPRAWAEFFATLVRQGEAGSITNALLTLPLGVLIVAFHNVWSGIPAVLTIIGWCYVLKSLIYFVFPRHGLKAMRRVTIERSRQFVPAGVAMVALAGLFAFSLFAR